MEISIHRRLRIAFVALIATIAGLALASASSATAGQTDWYTGIGTQTFNYGDDVTLERSVKAWVADDGRYRVIVKSPDGASEEFVFDGTDSFMFITPPGSKSPMSVIERDSAWLWAVEGHQVAAPEHARPNALSAPSRRDTASGMSTLVEHEGIEGSSYRLEMSWSQIDPNEDLLQPAPTAIALLMQDTHDDSADNPANASGPSTRSVNSNSQTFYDNLYTQGPCVFGKNYRDAEDSYLRAYSSVQGQCDQIGVSLFHGSQKQGGAGFCEPHGLLASGTHASYKNYSLYTAWDTPTCTAHAGWWESLLVVNYQGLTTVPYND